LVRMCCTDQNVDGNGGKLRLQPAWLSDSSGLRSAQRPDR
jgi:hypothetical protein